MEKIDDPDDPRFDDYRHLTDAAARRSVTPTESPHGIFVSEGLMALHQLLASGIAIRSVLLTPSRADHADDIPSSVPVLIAERRTLERVCGYDVHRGVLAAADRPEPAAPARLISESQRILVLEGVSDNENVGALFRNAAAFGFDAVLMDRACTDPFYRRSIRVSSGWSMRIPHARVSDTASALSLLHSNGTRTLALTPSTDATAVDELASSALLADPVALIVGTEGAGLTEATIDACDRAVRVPMAGNVDSLNVATSFAVVAAFAAAQRHWA